MLCKNKRKLFAGFAVALILNIPVIAAAPTVSVDESVYVTMDYYGSITDTSIVKGCDINGNNNFVDYGNYSKVTNMSTNDQPKLLDDHVEWNLPKDMNRFYFECVPKDMGNLPWSIDVSYSLNGSAVRAEELAGVSGLVQVDIKALPNDDVSAYYKHNMMLIAITMADMEDVRSFRADGAQMQTIGSKKAAIFVAMPGEDTSFSYQIGSDNFESPGTIFLIAPITLSQLDQLSDLKDAKARTESAFDAMSSSLDIILNSLAELPDGLRQTQEAINTLDKAREIVYDSKDGMVNRIDRLNEKLYGESVTLRNLGSDLNKLDDEDLLDDLGSSLSDSGKYISDVSGSLNAVNNRLSGLKGALDEYRKIPNSPTPEEAKAIVDNIQKAITELEDVATGGDSGKVPEETKKLLATLQATLKNLQDSGIDSADKTLTQVEEQLSGGLGDLAGMSDALSSMISTGDGLIGEIYDTLDEIKSSGIITGTKRVVTSTALLMDELRNTNMYIQETVKDCEDYLNEGLAGLNVGANSLIDTAVNGLDQTGVVKQYKDVIKNTIDNEWDRLADDLGLFDIDVGADKISFTSEKNPIPDSIQIILRTQEISIPDEITDEKDLEASTQNQGIWYRVEQVFIKIWNGIQSIFE